MAMTSIKPPPCERCEGATKFAGFVNRLGDRPGAQIFRCAACGFHTWVPDYGSAQAPPAASPQPQLQQQQQQQTKRPDDDE